MGDNTKVFINLTDGLEWLDVLQSEGHLPQFEVTRIQSTKLEQCKLNQVIEELDTSVLLYLALGYSVIILDCGSRKATGESRVVWYGIPILKYIIEWRWFSDNHDYNALKDYSHPVYVGASNIQKSLDEFLLHGISSRNKHKLDYFKKFIQKGIKEADIRGLSIKAKHDGDYALYSKLAKAYL